MAPTSKDVLHTNLIQALKKRDLNTADHILGHLKQEDPLSAITRGGELELLLLRDRLDEARTLAESLVEQFPTSARILYLAGKVAYRHKHYDKAKAWFDESHCLHPHHHTEQWLCKTLVNSGQFDEAEHRLIELTNRYPIYLLDLAWLYERQMLYTQAIAIVERYQKQFPDKEHARATLQRLRGALMNPHDVIEEANALQSLDEPIPPSLAPRYLEALLETGQSATARNFVEQQLEHVEPKPAKSMAWICYRLQAYDLTVDLFLRVLRFRAADLKLFRTLESAAARCNRIDELISAYQELAPEDGSYYGRIKRIQR